MIVAEYQPDFLDRSGDFALRFKSSINAGMWVLTTESPFLIVSVSYFFGIGLFATRYWEPVLYLLAAVHAGVLGVLWALSGFRYTTAGIVTVTVSIAFLIVVLFLFVAERRGNGDPSE